MPASVRRSASQPSMMSSNGFDRWLISRIDMPTPGSDSRSRCACSSTSTGRIAGPAEKLKMRVVVVMIFRVLKRWSVFLLSCRRSKADDLQIEDVGTLPFDAVAQHRGRSAIEVDAGHRRLCPLEDDIFRLLHVQVVQ